MGSSDERHSDNVELLAALNDGILALAGAIGRLEAHWEVCAHPFPDATLRRALDRMSAARDAASGRRPDDG